MDNKEIELLLKQFKSHVNGLMDAEDEIVDLEYQLKGIKPRKFKMDSNEAQSDGTKIYKNNVIVLNLKVGSVTEERNYHLFAVRQVMKMLQELSNAEVELLELHYWDRLSLRAISRNFTKFRYSESYLYKQIQAILDKMKVLS